MNILIIGASGKTGQHLLRQLIEQGHRVTAYARTPDKVDTYGGKVQVIQGDARDAQALTKATVGQDAVMVTFGPRSPKPDDLQTVFMQNLVNAMHATGVRRLVLLSAWGATDSRPQANWLIKLLLNTMLRNVFVDKKNGEEAIMASDLDYTFVRPAILLNVASKGRVSANLTGKGLKLLVSRADVASFMIEQLSSDQWHRQAPLIGYPK
ncbi:MAG: epimerase [Candidatus Saccharibacteria bacterium]|nr:epimerase [Candidatus Saccharibacteria bacterium]